MSTPDVPGSNPVNNDKLAMGSWAEHEDGSLILVEGTEGNVVYSIFDVAKDPPQEYRDAMNEAGFKAAYSWEPKSKRGTKTIKGVKPEDVDVEVPNLKWTWHDKTPFPWERVMKDFPAGVRHASVGGQLTAAERVAESLQLRAEGVRDLEARSGRVQRAANQIGRAIIEALETLRP